MARSSKAYPVDRVPERQPPLLELLDLRPNETVLHLGAGTGHLAAKIAATGARVTGLDASQEMVEEARRLHPDIDFIQGDAADFRLDTSFDAVFSNATLHWVKHAAAPTSNSPGQRSRDLKKGLSDGGNCNRR